MARDRISGRHHESLRWWGQARHDGRTLPDGQKPDQRDVVPRDHGFEFQNGPQAWLELLRTRVQAKGLC